MSKCDRWANHDLVEIYYDGHWDGNSVVKWCEACGAIVVDFEIDGRVFPGKEMKMKVPEIIKNQFIKEGKLNA